MALLFTAVLGISALMLVYVIAAAHEAQPAANYGKIVALAVAVMVLMLIVVITSFFISTVVVRRINSISITARQIMETNDLSKRIAIDSKWDDLSDLAATLNGMLARVEMLMTGIRDVSDNIAHDLRTPLARLRGKLEVMKQAGELAPEKADSVIAEADQLLNTFAALLRIAAIEKNSRQKIHAMTNMRSLIEDILELYEPLAEEKDISITADLGDASLVCDRDMLFQACANILDNAIKFTPQGGAISVSLCGPKGATLVFKDSGIGISEKDKPRVFERFYRSETSRSTAGNGLGLTLAGAVVALHHGTISLGDNHPGLVVTITL